MISTHWRRAVRLQHLELARAVVAESSLAGAAKILNLSQSAATKNLQSLERAVGCVLFERRAAGLVPTEAGEAFIDAAGLALRTLDDALLGIHQLNNGQAGLVRIGTLIAASSMLLPSVVEACAERYPGITIELIEGLRGELHGKLLRGDIDLVVGRSDMATHDRSISERSLYADPIVVVAHRDHPLAGVKRVSPARLSRADWILPPRGTALRRELNESFKRAGQAPPRSTIESVVLSTNLNLLHGGRYVAAMPGQAFHNHGRHFDLVVLKTTLSAIETQVGVSCRSAGDHGPAVATVLALLDEAAADLCKGRQ